MNGANGYSPSYGAPPPPPPQYGAALGAAPQQQSAYGAFTAPVSQQHPSQHPSQPPQHPSQPPQAYSPPPQAYAYAQPVPSYGPPGVQYPQQGMPMMGVSPKNPGLAVALELLGGFFLQTFGIGHLYSGNVGMGLGLMFGYWALTAVNIFLCFIFVGFITWPLTWLAFMILSAITASGAAKKANAKVGLAY